MQHDWEQLISLGQAARYLGPTFNTQAVWRACRRGTKSREGKRVYLEHARFGRKIFTTRGWLNAFLADLRAADLIHFQTDELGGDHSAAARSIAVTKKLSLASFNCESKVT